MSKTKKAKRNKNRRKPSPKERISRSLPPAVCDALLAAERLDKARRWDEARELLEPLDRRYPRRRPILRALANIYYELDDMLGYRSTCQQLVALEPDDPDLRLALAGSCAALILPVQAMANFKHFVDRWPDDVRAESVVKTIRGADESLSEALADLGLDGDDALQVAAMHEEVICLLQANKFSEARSTAQRLLKQRPDFIPALNNLSLACFEENQPDRAIAAASRVVELAPDNVHALANLTRFRYMLGQTKEARHYLERLKASKADAADAPVKKVEAMCCLGDDREAIEVVEGLGPDDWENMKPPEQALLYHLAAVATLRLGKESEARRRWKSSLRVYPGFELAKENLSDLNRPIEQRHGPWSFHLQHWVPSEVLTRCAERLARVGQRGDDRAVTEEIRRIVAGQPRLAAALPQLLQHGDPAGREFALEMAIMLKTPESIAALKEFALGQAGPDCARFRAAEALVNWGCLPAGPIRFWAKGDWQDVVVMGFDVHDEPNLCHGPEVNDLAANALLALEDDDADRAEASLEKALAIEPDAPDLLNNLATAYRVRGERRRYEKLAREIHQRFPDYFFGNLNMAIIHLENGELDRAQETLDPLLSRKRLHRTEFNGLCVVQIEWSLAKNNLDAAKLWIEMLEKVEPGHPRLPHWRRCTGAGPQAAVTRFLSATLARLRYKE